MRKQFSALSVAVDLVIDEHKITNPVLIAEKIEEEFDMDVTIHQVADYMEVERMEDFETMNRRQYYGVAY